MTEQKLSISEKSPYKVTFAQIERYVDTVNVSYDDAFRHFEVTPDQVDYGDDLDCDTEPILTEGPKSNIGTLRSIEPGPSLSLLGRARALDVIMSQFNQHNKAQGANFSRGYNGMEARYGASTDEVLYSMQTKSARMGKEAIRALETLSGGDSGVAMPESTDFYGSIQAGLRKEYGPGSADVGKREKYLTKAYKAAHTTKTAQRRQF